MQTRQRKFIGIIVTLIVMVVYTLLAMKLGSYSVGSGRIIELVVFIALGLGWLPLVMLIIKWSVKAPPEK